MPIYEYQCDAPDCGHTFDSLQKMSDAPISICPDCNGTQVRKLISASSFVLKGSGWYQTDIARKEKAAKAAHTSGEKSESKQAPKVDAKPESKPESKVAQEKTTPAATT